MYFFKCHLYLKKKKLWFTQKNGVLMWLCSYFHKDSSHSSEMKHGHISKNQVAHSCINSQKQSQLLTNATGLGVGTAGTVLKKWIGPCYKKRSSASIFLTTSETPWEYECQQATTLWRSLTMGTDSNTSTPGQTGCWRLLRRGSTMHNKEGW